jgi:hypothetical protein
MSEPDLGDARLNKRLLTLLEQLAAMPTASFAQACGTWAATKAAYRFMDSEKATPQAIRDAHHLTVRLRLGFDERVLAIQDSTSLDFTSQPHMQGLGPIDFADSQGLLVHSLLLASTQGVPQGLLWQKVWARDPQEKGQSHHWRKRALEDKESYKWLQTLQHLEWALPPSVAVVLMGDREADMYPLFVAPRREKTHLLVRAAYDRRVSEEAHTLFAAVEQAPLAGTRTLEVARRGGQAPREALLEVRFATITLLAPAYYHGTYPPVTLTVIQACETHPAGGVTPLHWVLLTSLPVSDFGTPIAGSLSSITIFSRAAAASKRCSWKRRSACKWRWLCIVLWPGVCCGSPMRPAEPLRSPAQRC